VDKLSRLKQTLPDVFNTEVNPTLKALLTAIASSDTYIETLIQNTKAQFFVKTAEDQYLDVLANNLGIVRPPALNLLNEDFSKLIPNLSFKSKQRRRAFYDTADVFWGPLFSRTNIQTTNFEPFNVQIGDTFKISVDGRSTQTTKVLATDVAIPGAATALEVSTFLSKIPNITPTILEDPNSGDLFINIRTNTPGPRGSLEVLSTSTILGTGKLEFPTKKTRLREQGQRVSIYEVRSKELIIEIPAIVPTLRKTLRGSHHLHIDSTLEPPQPPSGGVWRGSFLFDPNGTKNNYSVTGQKVILQQPINAGTVVTSITVDNTTPIIKKQGFLIAEFGMENEEQPIPYRAIPNTNTILIDPSYIFMKSHAIGTILNYIIPNKPIKPQINGNDFAIYLTSPSDARLAVQAILETLKAEGIKIVFIILAPKYTYLLDNPYLETDNAPT